MEKLLMDLLKAAKKNKKGFALLKLVAVRCGQYELASQLREIELKTFKETDDEKEAAKIKTVLAMVDIDVSDEQAWVISKAISKHNETKDGFSIKDVSEIRAKQIELF